MPQDSCIAAILPREDYRDVFLSTHKTPLSYFNEYKKIGTSSLRRKSQLLAVNNNLKILPVRGNVDTRIQKMLDGYFDGLVLAAAGVKRLGLEKHITEYLDLDVMLTAPGQGAIALEARNSDEKLKKLLSKINDEKTYMCVSAERSFLNTLGGGCHVPFAAYANIENEHINIKAFVGSLDGEININLVDKVSTILDNAKAENICVIDLKNKTSIADFFILATCRSSRHADSTAEEVINQLKKNWCKMS